MISTPSGSICFAADTGYGEHFAEIRERLGAPRLALLPIGAFRPEWFMSRVHMSPEQAIGRTRDLGAQTTVATHYGTFRLADDAETEAPERIAAAELASSGCSRLARVGLFHRSRKKHLPQGTQGRTGDTHKSPVPV